MIVSPARRTKGNGVVDSEVLYYPQSLREEDARKIEGKRLHVLLETIRAGNRDGGEDYRRYDKEIGKRGACKRRRTGPVRTDRNVHNEAPVSGTARYQ